MARLSAALISARKRLDETILASADQGRERLVRIAAVLEAMTKALRNGKDVAEAVTSVASIELIEADAQLIRRTTKPGRPDVIGELGPEYRVFKQVGSRFLATFTFEGRNATSALRTAMAVLVELGSNWRKPLPSDVPLGHIDRRWHRQLFADGKIDRTYWELATYFSVSSALASGDLLGTIASSGHVHKCPEKSPKSKVFDGWRVHPHPVKFVAIDGIRRYF